ncbi:hypothetical protein CQS04_12040 [Chryseomicrobium excrementi]|uniref:Uncharacterized protein n=1 Tax=Chryseomicrobium excrementi TaxID=2041346 RepID=A0A2M9EXL7_9BACL|nr:hypothetical protein [Chryseomicrobium excrementi]PJK15957.1 hypothetical protein CQS04_12040 [Chryseomicrobium excrementi]
MKWNYAVVILPLLVIVGIIANNTYAASKSYDLIHSVSNETWSLEYTVSKQKNDDWVLTQNLYAKEPITLKEITLSTEFQSDDPYTIGNSEMKSQKAYTYENPLIISSEYERLPNTKRLSDEEILEILSHLVTTVTWNDGKGKVQEVEMEWE